jgi:hypothetical protein
MTTKTELISKLKKEYPVLKVGNDDDGYVELQGDDYAAQIEQWADGLLEQQNHEAALQAAADAKAALLAKLGITADEAALLLA